MLTLITFPDGFDEPSLSPFCVKAMIQLDMAGVDWRPEYTGTPGDGPLGRLPALRTPEGVIPESGFIQTYLEGQGAVFHMGLSSVARVRAHALVRMIEEHLRLGIAHDRWLVDACWEKMKPVAFASVPAPIRPAVATMARRQVRSGLKSQGFARMTEAQRMACFQPDLDCLTDHLWDTPYLLGDHPTAPDTIAVPVLSMLAGLPASTALRETVRRNATLMAYIDRGRAALYPKTIRSAAAA
ncbi:glutathione S-transferase family protein [Marivita sp. S6314]|uniref:glutathione S-transferase family protein n=1 Tax=Marivita sp. S6314 TaxID=2926406 RepID=UPI001FF1A3B0|nr:Tom37 metaxin N-terminal-like domain-containing protein [Marivita sp. S6314]MCK0151679.1 glutathione S-transferase family protein [Marivita sp. S6314]